MTPGLMHKYQPVTTQEEVQLTILHAVLPCHYICTLFTVYFSVFHPQTCFYGPCVTSNMCHSRRKIKRADWSVGKGRVFTCEDGVKRNLTTA